jgi:SAM-dependent methyltransferase
MEPSQYRPEEYWNSVALNIERRNKNNVIAGDDEPYYLYKREKFLRILHDIPFKNKKIIEIGCGPGGNLREILKDNPQELVGVDISNEMIRLSKELISDKAEIIKINGTELPFPSNHFEIAFTSTVLQHITDEVILNNLINEMCRVGSKDIYLFERIEKKRKADVSNIGRTVKDYSIFFENNNFILEEIKFLNVHWSWFVCGTIRKVFNSKKRKEGEKETTFSRFFQRVFLFITKPLDDFFPVKRDLAMLHFKKMDNL